MGETLMGAVMFGVHECAWRPLSYAICGGYARARSTLVNFEWFHLALVKLGGAQSTIIDVTHPSWPWRCRK